jgi:ribose transport system substrate-binding protein
MEAKMRIFMKLATLLFIISAGQVYAAGLDELPAETQKLYAKNTLDPVQPTGESAYRNWKPKKGPPWTIGYASSYAGNTWRAGVMDRLQNELVPKWKKLGLIKEVVVTQSNLKDATQIQQIRQLVDQGVDAIILCCSNPTALNQSVKYAYDKGVPVFSSVGYLTSPYSVNSSTNFEMAGSEMAEWMAKEINEKGNVLIVQGIPGTGTSDSLDRGIKKKLAAYPNIKIVGDVAGMWTDQVAQSEVQKWLATNPGQLDGIIVQSASELGVLRALQQSGRKMIPITIGENIGALCYWKNNPKFVSASFVGWPPGDDFELSWNIMMRTLQGQGPKIQSILVPPKKLTHADVVKALPNCNENSDKFQNIGIAQWGGKDNLDQFFLKPADPEKFKK